MQPSTGKWDRFMYTVGKWLIECKNANEIATKQPVSMIPNELWTDSFVTAARWASSDYGEKRIKVGSPARIGKRDMPELFDNL